MVNAKWIVTEVMTWGQWLLVGPVRPVLVYLGVETVKLDCHWQRKFANPTTAKPDQTWLPRTCKPNLRYL